VVRPLKWPLGIKWLNIQVKTAVELIIKRHSFLSDVDGGDVDDSVCELFVYMNSDLYQIQSTLSNFIHGPYYTGLWVIIAGAM
jgi:hypothetical protein